MHLAETQEKQGGVTRPYNLYFINNDLYEVNGKTSPFFYIVTR